MVNFKTKIEFEWVKGPRETLQSRRNWTQKHGMGGGERKVPQKIRFIIILCLQHALIIGPGGFVFLLNIAISTYEHPSRYRNWSIGSVFYNSMGFLPSHNPPSLT